MKLSIQVMNNKIFFLPVNTGYYCSGTPTEKCIEFYKERSHESLYCSIIGNVSTLAGFGTNSRTGVISRDETWNKLCDEIKKNGTKPGIQLSRTWENYAGQKIFKNKKWQDYSKGLIQDLKKIELSELFDDFFHSIELAESKGFEHIQIHAAHGYLLSSLLDPNLYDRFDNVVKYLGEISCNFRSRLELSIRVSAFCGFTKIIEENRFKVLSKLFCGKYEYVDLSEGYYNFDKNYIYPKTVSMREARLNRGFFIAEKFDALAIKDHAA